MTQRTLAAVIALPAVLALIIAAWVVPLQYTIFSPGPTVDLVGRISVSGKHAPKTYPDPASQIRMVTVEETLPQTHLGLWELLGAWASRDDAVYPESYAYQSPKETNQKSQQQGQVEMTGAQQTAEEVALDRLGYSRGAKVGEIEKGSPAVGHLRPGDVIEKVGSTRVTSAQSLIAATRTASAGHPLTLSVLRHGKPVTVRVTPVMQDGEPHVGITISDYVHAPFQLGVDVDPTIGGPSAGLMMTLAIYDYLTPGSLTHGQAIAGTGEIEPDGSVAPIGGIQQKIPAAKRDGAKLFLVPASNCEDIAHADHGSMRLAKVSTFSGALKVIRTWSANPDAPLPTCGSGS